MPHPPLLRLFSETLATLHDPGADFIAKSDALNTLGTFQTLGEQAARELNPHFRNAWPRAMPPLANE